MKNLFALIAIALTLPLAHAQEDSADAPTIVNPPQTNFPRAASLKRSEVYVRSGPGTRYPILWVFQRKDWPIAILNKYDNWFKIRDIEGEEGWVYIGMVSGEETALISQGDPVLLSKRANGEAPIYRLAANVIVKLEDCAQESPTCRVSYNNKVGFVSPHRVLKPNLNQ